MIALPRPVTQGPWVVHGLDVCAGDDVVAEATTVAADIGDGQGLADHTNAAAIAALPEWIARADRYEAALREIADAEVFPDASWPLRQIARRALDGES